MSIIPLAALFLLSFLYVSVRTGKRPPGPGWVPFLGSLPYLTLKRGIHDWFLDRNVINHKISTVFIFRTELFVINDFDIAKVIIQFKIILIFQSVTFRIYSEGRSSPEDTFLVFKLRISSQKMSPWELYSTRAPTG